MAKTILIILDGLGLNPVEKGNPIIETPTPYLDTIINLSPHINLSASAEAVGLSWGEVGNSEVGHSNIGTGQIVWQDLPRIDQTIEDGSFAKNEVIKEAMNNVKKNNSSLHLLGLVSDGGVHSHIKHLFALLDIAKASAVKDVFIHVFTDGRDTPQDVAKRFIGELNKKTSSLGLGKISTIAGRFYAMDRDDHWERIKKVYDCLTGFSHQVAKSAEAAIDEGYRLKLNDENIEPTIISLGEKKQFIADRDSLILFNFRADRAREITLAIAQEKFKHFAREKAPKDMFFATMTPYETDWKIDIRTIFGSLKYENPLSAIISQKKLKQLHIAETEKYAHVTYFFNGGREKEMPGEEYVCIPSPRVDNFAKIPEMSLNRVTSELLGRISKSDLDFVVVNFANPDMVGHTGDYKAAQKALIAVDKNLSFLVPKVQQLGYKTFITADHGNVEQMVNLETGEIDKEHTINPIFFLSIGKDFSSKAKITSNDHKTIWQELSVDQPKGVLADITPMVAESLEIIDVSYFSGQSLRESLV
jgi:2,3-bisphosphoglycerate-independent phosphoglycerate mutase